MRRGRRANVFAWPNRQTDLQVPVNEASRTNRSIVPRGSPGIRFWGDLGEMPSYRPDDACDAQNGPHGGSRLLGELAGKGHPGLIMSDIGEMSDHDESSLSEEGDQSGLVILEDSVVPSKLAVVGQQDAKQTQDRSEKETTLPTKTQKRDRISDIACVRGDDIADHQQTIVFERSPPKPDQLVEFIIAKVLNERIGNGQVDRSARQGVNFARRCDRNLGILSVSAL